MRKYIFLGILVILLLSITGAHAHEWYSNSCCAGIHCHPIDSCTEIIDKGKGYLEWNGYTFSPDQVHPSQDNLCHVCTVPYWENNVLDTTKGATCVYIQQGS